LPVASGALALPGLFGTLFSLFSGAAITWVKALPTVLRHREPVAFVRDAVGEPMTRRRLHLDLDGTWLDAQGRQKIAETLGIAPRDALSALVGYGLHDHQIARYHGLPRELVTELREFWHIPANP